jgi:WD40 repeat protein
MLNRFLLLSIFLLALYTQTSAQEDCSTAPFPRLRAGITAQTSSGQSNNVRDAAHADANRIGQIPPDSQFQVLSEATCADGYYWFQVDYQGLVGWTVEGAEGEYWLFPALSNSKIITPENASQLQVINEFSCPEEQDAAAIAWTPDGSQLLWGCEPSTLYLTDWFTQTSIELSLADARFQAERIFGAFYAEGTRLMSYAPIRRWDVSTTELISQRTEFFGSGNGVATHGNMLAVSSSNHVFFYDLASGLQTDFFTDENFTYVFDLAFSPDGSRLAYGGIFEMNARIRTIETGETLDTAVSDPTQTLRFSPSGRYVLASICIAPNRGDCEGAALVWIDAATGEITNTWQEADWRYIWDIRFGEDLVFIRVNRHFEIIQISSDQRLYSSTEDQSDGEILPSIDGRLVVSTNENRLLIYGVP